MVAKPSLITLTMFSLISFSLFWFLYFMSNELLLSIFKRESWKKLLSGAYWLAVFIVGWSFGFSCCRFAILLGDPEWQYLFSWTIQFLQIGIRFLPGVIQLAMGTGRQRRQQNDTIQYIDFHLISPFSAVYLTPSFYYPWCPKSGTSLIQFLKRFNLLSELGLG